MPFLPWLQILPALSRTWATPKPRSKSAIASCRYPLVITNSSRTGKSRCFMDKSTISMVIFHSYLQLPEGISNQIPLNHHFPMGFPMVFLWFSYGFPMVQRSVAIPRPSRSGPTGTLPSRRAPVQIPEMSLQARHRGGDEAPAARPVAIEPGTCVVDGCVMMCVCIYIYTYMFIYI